MMRLRKALLTQKVAAPIGNRNIPSEFGSKPYEPFHRAVRLRDESGCDLCHGVRSERRIKAA